MAETLLEARALAGKVQGRRTTVDPVPPLELPEAVPGGVRLATGWVEPAYLEPDASWCAPGGEPATPLANGGAFGGKAGSPAPATARELADATGRPVRVVYSREDVVRLGPKRPPIAAVARWDDGAVLVHGSVAGDIAPFVAPSGVALRPRGTRRLGESPGDRSADVEPPAGGRPGRTRAVSARGRAARGRSGPCRAPRRPSPRAVSLASCVAAPSGTLAGARVECDEAGRITGVHVRVAAGDPLDGVVLRSYAIGAAHMALGWVLTEGLAVDPETGDVHDLTIRSFGILRAKDTPPIHVELVDDAGRRVRSRPMRCSPRSRRRRGTPSPTPRASDRRRSPPVTPAPERATPLTAGSRSSARESVHQDAGDERPRARTR